MATLCTHIRDGKPVTEIVEDGKARPWDGKLPNECGIGDQGGETG